MVTGEKQESQHDDSPREVESIVDKLAETDMLLSQMEFAGPVQWLGQMGHVQLDTPPHVHPVSLAGQSELLWVHLEITGMIPTQGSLLRVRVQDLLYFL